MPSTTVLSDGSSGPPSAVPTAALLNWSETTYGWEERAPQANGAAPGRWRDSGFDDTNAPPAGRSARGVPDYRACRDEGRAASISLVLNRTAGARAIPRATQERILAAARRFHYRPNNLARSLRQKRSFTVGVMVPEISEGYASLVMSGIEDCLLQQGYLYFITSHRHRADLIDEYPKLMLGRSVDGIIAIDTPCRRSLGVPVVSVSGHSRTAGVTNITLDHDRADGGSRGSRPRHTPEATLARVLASHQPR